MDSFFVCPFCSSIFFIRSELIFFIMLYMCYASLFFTLIGSCVVGEGHGFHTFILYCIYIFVIFLYMRRPFSSPFFSAHYDTFDDVGPLFLQAKTAFFRVAIFSSVDDDNRLPCEYERHYLSFMTAVSTPLFSSRLASISLQAI